MGLDAAGDELGLAWLQRLATVWGHFASELLSGSIVAAIAIGLRPPPGQFALTVPLALIVFVLVSWLCMRRHDRRLCEQCAASLPLNASEQASRYRRRFWFAHAASDPRFLAPYLVVLIGSNLATGSAGRLGWTLMQASMIYLIMSNSTHRRLQPWCPTCRNGGGGTRRDEGTRDPVLPDNRHLV